MVKNRVICVPKKINGEFNLNKNQFYNTELIERIITENEFNYLWKHQIFDLINESAKSLIDDFESESIIEKERIINVINKLTLYN